MIPFKRYSRVPVLFGDPVEAGEHDGQDDAGVLLDQTHDVLVVPVVESSLCNLPPKHKPGSVSVENPEYLFFFFTCVLPFISQICLL